MLLWSSLAAAGPPPALVALLALRDALPADIATVTARPCHDRRGEGWNLTVDTPDEAAAPTTCRWDDRGGPRCGDGPRYGACEPVPEDRRPGLYEPGTPIAPLLPLSLAGVDVGPLRSARAVVRLEPPLWLVQLEDPAEPDAVARRWLVDPTGNAAPAPFGTVEGAVDLRPLTTEPAFGVVRTEGEEGSGNNASGQAVRILEVLVFRDGTWANPVSLQIGGSWFSRGVSDAGPSVESGLTLSCPTVEGDRLVLRPSGVESSGDPRDRRSFDQLCAGGSRRTAARAISATELALTPRPSAAAP